MCRVSCLGLLRSRVRAQAATALVNFCIEGFHCLRSFPNYTHAPHLPIAAFKMMGGRRTDQKTAKKELKSNLMVLGAWFAVIRLTPFILQAFQKKQ